MKIEYNKLIEETRKVLQDSSTPLSRREIYENLLCADILEPNTRNQFDEVIKTAIKKGDLDKSKLKKSAVKSQRLPSVLRINQLKKIVDVIESPKEMIIFLTAFFCGLRRVEVTKLKKQDIEIGDQNAMFLKVIQGKRQKDRFVTLPHAYVRILKLWLEYIADSTNDYLIPAKNGLEPINKDYLNTRFKRNLEKAGLLKIEAERTTVRKSCKGTPIKRERLFNYHFHSLRHSYATFRIECGDNPQNVMEELGHNDMETLQIYTHISLEARQKATNKVFGYGRELPNLIRIERNEESKAYSYDKGQLELENRKLEIEEKRLEVEKLKLLKDINPYGIKQVEETK